MRTEAEVRERLKHWRHVLGGVLKRDETTISHFIKELEWVLGNGVAPQLSDEAQRKWLDDLWKEEERGKD